jgi:hypothetical protein
MSLNALAAAAATARSNVEMSVLQMRLLVIGSKPRIPISFPVHKTAQRMSRLNAKTNRTATGSHATGIVTRPAIPRMIALQTNKITTPKIVSATIRNVATVRCISGLIAPPVIVIPLLGDRPSNNTASEKEEATE